MEFHQTSRVILVLLSIVCYIEADYSDGSDEPFHVCSSENRQNKTGFAACIEAIQNTMEDKDHFWFGQSYFLRCPPPTERGLPQFNLDCPNVDPASFSLADRILWADRFNTTSINSYLDVTIHEKPGSYQACGHTYTFKVRADHHLDPINPTPLTPWQAAGGFSASVEGLEDLDAMYTLLIMDAGFFFIHGLYIDIPGSNFDIRFGKPLMEYSGPNYFLKNGDLPNPYVFLLFKQEQFMEIFDNPMITQLWMGLLQQQALSQVDFSAAETLFKALNFANDLKMTGPVAVNWVMSLTDPYAAQFALDNRIANVCPMYVEEAARNIEVNRIPDDVPFGVGVFVTYPSEGKDFSICCQDYSYEDSIHNLDPIGDGHIDSFHIKDKPEVQLMKMSLAPNPTDFRAEMYTLIHYDPDIGDPHYGTTERPWLLWLVTNIPLGRVDMGREIVPYDGALSGLGATHRVQFMLYRQTRWLRNVNPFLYTPLCTDIGYRERCLFEMDRFVEENGLEFAGASWMVVKSDAYTATVLNDTLGLPEDFSCIGVPGYTQGVDCSGNSIVLPVTTDAPKHRKPGEEGGSRPDKGRRT